MEFGFDRAPFPFASPLRLNRTEPNRTELTVRGSQLVHFSSFHVSRDDVNGPESQRHAVEKSTTKNDRYISLEA